MPSFSALDTLLSDPCGALTLAALVFAIGKCTVGPDERVRRIGAGLGGIVFLATIWIGVARGGDVFTLAATSLAWAGLTVGTAWIVTALATGLARSIHVRLEEARRLRELADMERRRAEEERTRQEAEARHRAEMARIAAAQQPPPPAPEPTAEERLAAAKRRYEARLRLLAAAGLDEIELTAAREREKQKFLRELDREL